MVVQDGAHLCPNCAYPMALSDRNILSAQRRAEAAQLTAEHAAPLRYPGKTEMDGVPALEGTSPQPITVAPGGSGSLTLTGVNLSASDTITFGHAGITGSAYTPATTTATITVNVDGAVPRGTYSLTFNGARYPNVVRVF
jgi:hypothetical protein